MTPYTSLYIRLHEGMPALDWLILLPFNQHDNGLMDYLMLSIYLSNQSLDFNGSTVKALTKQEKPLEYTSIWSKELQYGHCKCEDFLLTALNELNLYLDSNQLPRAQAIKAAFNTHHQKLVSHLDNNKKARLSPSMLERLEEQGKLSTAVAWQKIEKINDFHFFQEHLAENTPHKRVVKI